MSQPVTQSIAGKRILVTGGAGFLGCAIAQLLAPAAARYIALDILHPQIHKSRVRPFTLHAAVELRVADVTVANTWDTVFNDFKPHIIIHLAAETGTGQSLTEASRHGLVNVVGTTRLTDALSKYSIHIQHIILTSSRAVYGEGAWRASDGTITYPGQRSRVQLEAAQWDFPGLSALPSQVDCTEPRPTSIYGATKLAQEQILSAWALAHKIPLSILRLQNVYGPGQSLTNSYTGIVALFSQLARKGQSIPLYEDGQMTRDFVFIDDVANAIATVLACPPDAIQCFDIGSGQPTTVACMARHIIDYYGSPHATICEEFRNGDVRHASCDLTKTLAYLDWCPQYSLKDGLIKLQSWLNTQIGHIA